MTRQEAIAILKVSDRTFGRYVAQGRIRYIRIHSSEYLYWDEDVYRMAGKTLEREYRIVVYSRVSGNEKEDRIKLLEQQDRVAQFAIRQGWHVDTVYEDACPSTEFSIRKRTGLYQLLADVVHRKVAVVLVEREDRIARMGSGLVDMLFGLFGVRLVILDERVDSAYYADELEGDLIALLEKVKKEKAKEALTRPLDPELTQRVVVDHKKVYPNWPKQDDADLSDMI